jgi:hypothetical protein
MLFPNGFKKQSTKAQEERLLSTIEETLVALKVVKDTTRKLLQHYFQNLHNVFLSYPTVLKP